MPDQIFTLGEHNAAIRDLLVGQKAMQDDITEIKESLAERRGERRAILWLGGTISTVISFVVTAIAALVARKH